MLDPYENQRFSEILSPSPISMLFALANHSFPGSAWKNPLCNSFNIETGRGVTKIRFFQQESNTFVRDCSLRKRYMKLSLHSSQKRSRLLPNSDNLLQSSNFPLDQTRVMKTFYENSLWLWRNQTIKSNESSMNEIT